MKLKFKLQLEWEQFKILAIFSFYEKFIAKLFHLLSTFTFPKKPRNAIRETSKWRKE